MVVITFRRGGDWYKANWTFRQLSEDVIESFPGDNELRFVLEQAQALGGLNLNLMDQSTADRISKAIQKVAADTLHGRIQGWQQTKPADHDGKRIYLEAIAELLNCLKKDSGEA